MKQFDITPIKKSLIDSIKEKSDFIKEKTGNKPKLAILRAGVDYGSVQYEISLMKKGIMYGVNVQSLACAENVNPRTFYEYFDIIIKDPDTHGLIVMQPLPPELDVKYLIERIPLYKDVDCFGQMTNVDYYIDKGHNLPCTAESILRLLCYQYGNNFSGLHFVIINRSNVIGKPLAEELVRRDGTVTICHSKTENIKDITVGADCIITATGQPNLIDASYIESGQFVIDAGTGELNGKVHGDLDLEDIGKYTYTTDIVYTGVTDGVGSITSLVLLDKVCDAALRVEGLKEAFDSWNNNISEEENISKSSSDENKNKNETCNIFNVGI